MPNQIPKTVLFINQKGGVGKTTLATNVAGAIADLKGDRTRVLLIDGDTATCSALGWHSRRAAELKPLPFDVVGQSVAHLSAATGKYGLFIIDTKAAPQEQDLVATVKGSDLILIPTMPDGASLSATFGTIRKIQELAPSEKGKVRVVINNIMVQASTQAMDIEKALSAQGIRCLAGHLNCYRSAYHPSTNGGLLAREVNVEQAKKAWAQCMSMASQIISLLEEGDLA